MCIHAFVQGMQTSAYIYLDTEAYRNTLPCVCLSVRASSRTDYMDLHPCAHGDARRRSEHPDTSTRPLSLRLKRASPAPGGGGAFGK